MLSTEPQMWRTMIRGGGRRYLGPDHDVEDGEVVDQEESLWEHEEE